MKRSLFRLALGSVAAVLCAVAAAVVGLSSVPPPAGVLVAMDGASPLREVALRSPPPEDTGWIERRREMVTQRPRDTRPLRPVHPYIDLAALIRRTRDAGVTPAGDGR